jgi:hypothetical protein
MDSDEVSLLIAGSGTVVGVGGLAMLLWQIRLLRLQINQAKDAVIDQQWRARRHSTLEFYGSTQDRRLGFLTEVPSLKDMAATRSFIELALQDNTTTITLRRFLNYYELIAAGVNDDIFDITIMDRVAGTTIMNIWRRYGAYIIRLRREEDHASMFQEIEQLAASIALRRDAQAVPDEPVASADTGGAA